ncbi:MAG: hypothetical protein QOJ76_2297, partial [Acidobacteriota bacterium]|nr:hypothetical protein [Acidobacteriota bacterium]
MLSKGMTLIKTENMWLPARIRTL